MKAKVLKKKYFDFFKEKNHKIIPSASLLPENDPTVLFTTAGMHPLVPYLLGQPHPSGKRIANVQKCLRTGDIEDVGNTSHLTFFEMLGNWSLGDYFKKESIEMSFEFLTEKKWLGFKPKELFITVFKGDKDAPKDTFSAGVWEDLGVPKNQIFYLPKEDNWWGPAGKTGPCGPDTEIFIDTGKRACSKNCQPGCNCGKYFEIWNNVFMEYNKTDSGKFIPLKQQNVDTGMGVERTAAIMQGKDSVYDIEIFQPIIKTLEKLSKKSYKTDKLAASFRIITDHLRSATFILGDPRGIPPSNLGAGYILRRLIRRAVRHGKLLECQEGFTTEVAKVVIKEYKDDYPELKKKESFICEQLDLEEKKFSRTLERGLREFERITSTSKNKISGRDAFILFTTYGFPLEMTHELANERKIKVDEKGFESEFKKHIEASKKGADKTFKGGLADTEVETTKLHTATHLLLAALRKVLKDDKIHQRGSNITAERLRFDFNFDRKVEADELKKVENLVNDVIKKGIEVKKEVMSLKDAKKSGATGVFEEKYGDEVSVYTIGNFSKELCGGPHTDNTKELGKFKIVKEESISAGVRRIRAVLE